MADAGLEAALSLAGWLASSSSSGGDKQAAAADGSAHYSHSHNRAQTAQPEDLGRDAGGARAGVRGWWMGDGVQHKPTWVRRLPPIRVGWLGGLEAGMERWLLMSVHGYLTCVLVSAASDEPGRQAGLTRACVSWACVDGRTRGCARGVCTVCRVGCVQHMRGRHGRRALPTLTST